jgi:hypothetical protein
VRDEQRIEITTEKVPALIQIPIRRVFGLQPINRVENWLIWPDGVSRPMTRRERLVMWLRLPLRPKRPSEVQCQLQRFVNKRLDHAFLHGDQSERRGG